jgi:hypothetical protein
MENEMRKCFSFSQWRNKKDQEEWAYTTNTLGKPVLFS